MDDPWSRQKDFWLTHRVSDDKLLHVIELYTRMRKSHTEQDIATIAWLSSRGARGYDGGGADTRAAAVYAGGFVYRPTEG